MTTEPLELIQFDRRGDVVVVRLNRPPANAMDPRLLDELNSAGDMLEADNPGAVVLTGLGDFFSGGLDLKLNPSLDTAVRLRMADSINRLVAAWYSFPAPVVGAVNGHAVAGGMILALCTDHRIGSSAARYGLTEVRVAVPYPSNALAVVAAELTPQQARILALRAELYEAEEAKSFGLLDEIVAREEVVPRALTVAQELAELPRRVYAHTKLQLRGAAASAMRKVVEEGDPTLRRLADE